MDVQTEKRTAEVEAQRGLLVVLEHDWREKKHGLDQAMFLLEETRYRMGLLADSGRFADAGVLADSLPALGAELNLAAMALYEAAKRLKTAIEGAHV